MTSAPLAALALGFFGSIHCFAMCGGVVVALSAGPPARGGELSAAGLAPCAACPKTPRRHWLAYNAGRIASYAAVGAVAGALGSNLVRTEEIRVGLRVIAALCMLFVGLQLAGLPTPIRRLESLGAPLWRMASPFVKRLLSGRSTAHALALGGAWGLMPCGVLYGALSLAASSGSASAGGLTMICFGAATLPAILVMMISARRITHTRWRRWAGFGVLAFGVYTTASLVLGSESPLCCALRH